MSLLLLRQRAKTPFCHGKLNIRLWSEQELCYIIYKYPLVCMEGLVNEALFDWIERELKNPYLSSRLRANQKKNEPVENQLLLILQECNYFDVTEVMKFSQKMADLKKCSRTELLNLEAAALYRAGNLNMAYEKFLEEQELLDTQIRKSVDISEKEKLAKEKALVFCDMAVIKLHMFDENAALEFLTQSELTYNTERAVKMRYLINGAGELSDKEKEKLDELKNEAAEKAVESKNYKEVAAIFDQDDDKMFREAARRVSSWKNNFRKM